jgi:hypothetical protein
MNGQDPAAGPRKMKHRTRENHRMIITRDQPDTGGKNRTKREEIIPLFTGPREVEPEQYGDASESTGWLWDSNPKLCTWAIQIPAMRSFTAPFAQLDSQASSEASGGGVFTYWFNHQYLPIEGKGEEDDMNPDNFDAKLAKLMARYPQFFAGGKPMAGGTQIMSAMAAADKRYLGEFPDPDDRAIRARVVWTDGALKDVAAYIAYLKAAKPSKDDPNLGTHYDKNGNVLWDEAWAVGILGEAGGGGQQAYEQYQDLRGQFPWIHSYYFENVAHPDEIAEDMATATVPTQA